MPFRCVLPFLVACLGCSRPEKPAEPQADNTQQSDKAPPQPPKPGAGENRPTPLDRAARELLRQHGYTIVWRERESLERKPLWLLSIERGPLHKPMPILFADLAQQRRPLKLGELAVAKHAFELYVQQKGTFPADFTSLTNLIGLTIQGDATRFVNNGSDNSVRGLEDLPNLINLNLSGLGISDPSLKRFVGFKQLRFLGLGSNIITDSGLRDLSKVANLKGLDLSNNEITDRGIKELAGLNHLEYLTLDGTGVTDAAMKDVRSLKKLRHLGLSFTAVSKAGLKELADLEQLSELHLGGTPAVRAAGADAGGSGLKELQRFKSLRKLTLVESVRPRSGIADSVISELQGLNTLTHLHLGNSALTDEGLKTVATLPELTVVRLNGTGITDAGIAQLAALKQLTELDLEATSVSDSGMKSLAGITTLTSLNLTDTRVTGAGLRELAPLKKLVQLNVKVNDGVIAALSSINRLDLLPGVDPEDERPTTAQQIRRLSLAGPQVTDKGMEHLAQLKALEFLGLSGCPITDACTKHLVELKNLSRLELFGTRVTPNGIGELRKALPNCVIGLPDGGLEP